ncbi:hypothetical protein, partial [Streptomyces scabiei]|uniref:hypothetical protein n=1 Tax=Streptomyces scabiei TaxID=1930 RepID=UPI0038F5D827
LSASGIAKDRYVTVHKTVDWQRDIVPFVLGNCYVQAQTRRADQPVNLMNLFFRKEKCLVTDQRQFLRATKKFALAVQKADERDG